MKIITFEGGFDNNFTYLITGSDSPVSVIVDAAVPVENLLRSVEKEGFNPVVLLITHTHYDHVAYIEDYQKSFPGLEICLFSEDTFYPIRRICAHLEKIRIGSFEFTVIHTPGHTPDSVCYLVDGNLFTGDTLFVGRTGRTLTINSDVRQLYRSVYSEILTLPGNTVIYPGHNYGEVRTITLGENIEISPLLRAANEDDFVIRMEEYEKSRT